MSVYSDIAAGIATTLRGNVTELLAFDFPPDSVNQFPAAVVIPEPIDTEIVIQGNTINPTFRIVFLVGSADAAEGFRALYDHIDPVEAGKSLLAAVRADRTMNGSVDDSDLIRIENIGRRELWGGFYFAFDGLLDVIKTVP
tara:strand:- start:1487 stop:1909 length:423 start_codon:yes stop_codon:yes gene_type:complete